MKLFGICEVCTKERFFIRKRTRLIGHGQKGSMTSKKQMCNKCWKILSKMI